MSAARRHLLCFGLGYTARALAARLAAEGWIITGTCRGSEQAANLATQGYACHRFDRDRPDGVRPKCAALLS